jgi:hypothetical protein
MDRPIFAAALLLPRRLRSLLIAVSSEKVTLRYACRLPYNRQGFRGGLAQGLSLFEC